MSSYTIPKDDINLQPFMGRPPEYTRKTQLMQTDRVYKCEITNITPLTAQERLYRMRVLDPTERQLFQFRPGQFVMLEVPGFGEVPISISSSADDREHFELCVRNVGKTTGVLARAKQGARIGIRGPFGTSFPMEEMEGRDVLLIAGGLGLAPLRAPLYWINERREKFGQVHLLYGTKTPEELLFTYQYEEWRQVEGIRLQTIVEHPSPDWKGPVGRITQLFDTIEINPETTYAIVCGPPVMFKFVCNYLQNRKVPMNRMFVSLERRMHCGMGKCCRCMVGSTFTCVDGPVFDYWSVINLLEAI